MPPAPIEALEATIGITFSDHELVTRALSHRSWCSEHGNVPSNERLEFLGDSVLGMVVTRYVFEHFPDLPEGELSEVRAAVVNARSLAVVAEAIGLGDHLLLGRGEDAAGGRSKPSILADAVEALFAAVYLDSGYEAARGLILGLLEHRIQTAAATDSGRDHKTRLQELGAARGLGRPRYLVRDDGPDHAKEFWATVMFDDTALGEGYGRSKKEAEQAAARAALAELLGTS